MNTWCKSAHAHWLNAWTRFVSQILSWEPERHLALFNDVLLRTRRALFLYKADGDSGLLVLNGIPLSSYNALLILTWQNMEPWKNLLVQREFVYDEVYCYKGNVEAQKTTYNLTTFKSKCHFSLNVKRGETLNRFHSECISIPLHFTSVTT